MPNKNIISSVMSEIRKLNPSKVFSEAAHIKTVEEYEKKYKSSVDNPEDFWASEAESLHWFKKWDRVSEYDFINAEVKWFEGGKINVSYNCLDRHLTNGRKDKTAIIWQGEPEEDVKYYTYQMLHDMVCRFSNVLKKRGVKKGDRVTIYMPMIPELAVAMLACTRIGAVHSIVFGGFSAESLSDRISDCGANILITADGGFRNGNIIPLKKNADDALMKSPSTTTCIVVKRCGNEINMKAGRDLWWHEEMKASDISPVCKAEELGSEDPLFILYTSGSTGKPKGVLHTNAGYLLHVTCTTKWIFDIKDTDIYWCTADIGWVTGHSYIIYGPLSNGATTLMFEGIPTYPSPDRFWQVVEKFKVNIFYTAPTAIRTLAKYGDTWVNKRDISSLRLLGTVGEPINPEAWMWYYKAVGKERCPIVDTWWQTETGGILITTMPGAMPAKPGSAGKPVFGIVPSIIKSDGTECDINEGGYLVITKPWPGITRTIYNDHERFKKTYFSQQKGVYFTGDGARKDEEGYFWLMGRIDDVLNVSGHRLGTAEIESALVSNENVAESSVVGFPHDIKGEGIYAFVTLKEGIEKTDELKEQLRKHVSKEIGAIAKPDAIQFADALPKTRSGKIMRRILKKIAAGDTANLGDVTTLADPSVVDMLVKERK